MSNSLRIAPPTAYPTSTTTSASAPSAPGIHDTLRASLNPSLSLAPTTSTSAAQNAHPNLALQSHHPLESRLAQWRATQQTLKHTLLRRQFGLAAPLIREMELLTVMNGDAARPSCLLSAGGGASGVHEDVLRGTDCEVQWEDVFGGDVTKPLSDFHTEMEQRLGMNW